ncbi:hypothetical protein QBZ16_000549 [Prototheca wickerhamii]|uniref:Conserved oligomeric Golgi complex subunit 7 n=1 Tax=Prototheca wickerhamii TaxID=3111 RepID=A0AAD9IND6_PROWI|nr:hypothetical protein QBZ16_000549 [Prototheca wickerhamii]
MLGEHLLLLPQVLESALLGEEGGEAAASPHASQEDSLGAVTDWTVRIAAEAAADLVRLALRPLPRLSGAGAAQLAADLEYFCNVLGSLGVEVPDELGAWTAAAAAPDARGGRGPAARGGQPRGPTSH